ncbi:MAG: ribose-phosphate pyrophosphokinase [Myxococcaceae bacterium]
MRDPVRIFAGSSNLKLAERVAKYLKTPLGARKITHFSDGETFVNIEESVRGHHVYILQSVSPPANENLMEMLIMIDALKRASASEITVVVPYYGYARQDRKAGPREPITAKLIADLLEVAGATRLISLDLHAAQIQGFFDVPVDNLYATPIFLEDIKAKFKPEDIIIVSPDAGGVERARSYAKRLESSLAIIDKRRPQPNIAEVMNIIGDVSGKTAIIIDDMIDTGGTLCKGAEALKKAGATGIWAYATHAVFSGEAVTRMEGSVLNEIVVTDSIPLKKEAENSSKIRVLSCSSLVGEAIHRVDTGTSVSSLFL